MISSRAAHIS